MDIRKKFLTVVAGFAVAALFSACGDDSGSNSSRHEGPSPEVAELELANGKAVVCDDDMEGVVAITADDGYRKCVDGEWIKIKKFEAMKADKIIGQLDDDDNDGDDDDADTESSSSQKQSSSSKKPSILDDDGDDNDGDDDDVIPSSSSSVIPSDSEGSSSSKGGSGVIPGTDPESPSEVKDDGYYKTNCPAGLDCKYATTTEYLNSEKTYGEILDTRDGQVYKTIVICDEDNKNCQTWMAQNLNYAPDPEKVSSMGDYAWSGCYENESANCSKYGRLYTWEVAMDKAGCGYGNYCENKYEGTQGVCPEGWHLPSVDEWDALFTAVGGFRTAGVKLKSVEGWSKSFSASTTGTDVYGFSALPAGEGYYDGGFDLVGRSAYFCSSTEDENLGGSRHAYYKALRYYSEGAHLDEEHKNYRRSVRCLKD